MDELTLLAESLRDRIPAGMTVCVGESLTGGLLGHSISRQSGASSYYLGTVCAYNIDIKVRVLGVNHTLARECDCVSLTVAEQMALGAALLFGGSFGLSCTGYATPNDSTPVAYCYWAISFEGGIVDSGKFVGDRNMSRTEMQEASAAFVLRRLVSYLNPPSEIR